MEINSQLRADDDEDNNENVQHTDVWTFWKGWWYVVDGSVTRCTTDMVQEAVLSGWTMFNVQARRRLLLTVDTEAGESTTADILKMSQSPALNVRRLGLRYPITVWIICVLIGPFGLCKTLTLRELSAFSGYKRKVSAVITVIKVSIQSFNISCYLG